MSANRLTDATDLKHWSDRLDARARLPELVRRLVSATVMDLTRITIPAGEGIQKPGVDGVVESPTGNAFVPAGISIWEMGVNTDPRSKAQDDYKKRTANPQGIKLDESTFIFVTPRRWTKKDDWASQKRSEGKWKDVRVLDADDLHTWLTDAPGVHIWISSHTGKSLSGVRMLESFWQQWSGVTAPALTPDLVLSGRDDSADELVMWLSGGVGRKVLQAESDDEALAFVAAAIMQLEEDQRIAIFSRVLLVNDDVTWSQIIHSNTQLVLLPRFEEPDVSSAIGKGHHVIIARSDSLQRSGEIDILPRIRRSNAFDAFVSMGFERERAEQLATLARRSFPALRRHLASSGTVRTPEWSTRDAGRILIPALFVGMWDDGSEGDREMLSNLAGVSYDDLIDNLVGWLGRPDAPLRRVGDAWYLASEYDAWSQIARYVTKRDLKRFESACLTVLGSADPAVELSLKDRPMASVLEKQSCYSGSIRTGLANSLALLGSSDFDFPGVGGVRGPQIASGIVSKILERADDIGISTLWKSLSNVLPLLAEAAPDRFLSTLDILIHSSPNELQEVFEDRDRNSSAFNSFSAHTYLLWALETLAWSPTYFSRATALLAALQNLDPGGSQSDRPAGSLGRIFLLWNPNTDSDWDRRLLAIDAIREKYSDAAWKLLLNILPRPGQIGMATHRPKWREWGSESREGIDYGELQRAIEDVIDRLLSDAGVDGNRWRELISMLRELTPDLRNRVIQELDSLDSSMIESPGREVLWDQIRGDIAFQKRYPTARASFSEDAVATLTTICDRLAPEDVVEANRWLFSASPALIDIEPGDGEEREWEAHRRAVETQRDQAVRAIYSSNGLGGVLALPETAEQGWYAGRTLGLSGLLDEDEEAALLMDLIHARPEIEKLASGYVSGRFDIVGWAWADEQLTSHHFGGALHQSRFLLSLPATSQTFDWVESLEAEGRKDYWLLYRDLWLNSAEDLERVLRSLLDSGRAQFAIVLVGYHKEAIPDRLSSDLVLELMEAAVRQKHYEKLASGEFQHTLTELLEVLDQVPEIDQSRVARIEWLYLPMLRYSARPASVLQTELARSPDFFAEVVSWIYRRADESAEEEPTDLQRFRAERAYELLNTWKRIPGLDDDGTVDQTTLQTWVDHAREALRERGLLEIGDQLIGNVLRHHEPGADGIWPAEPVREIIEAIPSQDLTNGIEIEVFNSRGVTTRGLLDGGKQEAVLMVQYLEWADALAGSAPRTSEMLRRIAEDFERDAGREDRRAELTEEFWR